MKYAIRSLKYLVLLCVLYVGLVWLMAISEGVTDIDLGALLVAHLESDKGPWMVVVFVVLALLYPRFGFMLSRVDNCNIKEDRLRINNAMMLFGFKLIEERDGKLVYRASSPLKRLMLMFEDEIIVRSSANGVELIGLRRSVARVAYQLKAYINNKRFEGEE